MGLITCGSYSEISSYDGEMNGDFYKVVQGGKNCPFLEKAKSCPNDVDDLPLCEDPCLSTGDMCMGTGPTASVMMAR